MKISEVKENFKKLKPIIKLNSDFYEFKKFEILNWEDSNGYLNFNIKLLFPEKEDLNKLLIFHAKNNVNFYPFGNEEIIKNYEDKPITFHTTIILKIENGQDILGLEFESHIPLDEKWKQK